MGSLITSSTSIDCFFFKIFLAFEESAIDKTKIFCWFRSPLNWDVHLFFIISRTETILDHCEKFGDQS